MFKNSKQKGVTLVEVIVCVAVFSVLSVSVYGIFTSIINGIIYFREGSVVSSLANQYLEIMRNMPYSEIGTIQGNPHGVLADLANPITSEINGNNYQIYYAISYIDDPSDGTILAGTDPAPNDYKQVKLYVKNSSSGRTSAFMTTVVPEGLEGMTSGGALYIKIFDAVGQPVPGATISIINNNVSPTINLTRTADSNGNWIEVALPESSNNYIISVTKSGYSVDQTYPVSESNPNPTKPYATIISSQVTQISFSIDQLSNLTFNTLNESCAPLADIGVAVRGSKLIGVTPEVYKFNNYYNSNSNGLVSLNNIEWDTYTPALMSSESYMIYGSSPIQQVSILPNTSQSFNLILGPKTDNSLLILVKDASTNNPIQGALVELQDGSNTVSGYSGGSILTQQDWSSGPGQEDFVDNSKYYQDDGNISNNIIPTGLRLFKNGEPYVSSGWAESSTFDTGTEETIFTTLTWQPVSQDPSTSIKFQIAANNNNETWSFIGPDGTDQTYYEVSGTTITNLNNNRYIRYKVFFSTIDPSKTPVLTSININYFSGCSAPGQVMFPGLEKKEYQATVSMNGYQTQITNISVNGYNNFEISLSQ